MNIKVRTSRHKTIVIILRISYRGIGIVGASFVATDFKWTGLAIMALAGMLNEALSIIKEEEDGVTGTVENTPEKKDTDVG